MNISYFDGRSQGRIIIMYKVIILKLYCNLSVIVRERPFMCKR